MYVSKEKLNYFHSLYYKKYKNKIIPNDWKVDYYCDDLNFEYDNDWLIEVSLIKKEVVPHKLLFWKYNHAKVTTFIEFQIEQPEFYVHKKDFFKKCLISAYFESKDENMIHEKNLKSWNK